MLDLSFTRGLRELPKGIGSCPKLQTIYLKGSAVQALPEDLAGAPSLKEPDLRGTMSLRTLPKGLESCPALETISPTRSAVKALP